MADNNYIIQLKAALDKAKSEKQINQDLKAIEKNIRQLNLVASLYKGDSKKQLDSVIAELESKVQVVKLRTKFDQKQTQKEVEEALNNVSFSDIKLDKQGIELAAQKAYNILDSVISKHTITPAIEWKKGKLQKELQDFLKQNSKIQESAAFKKQAEEVEGLFAAASNADTLDYATEKFKLFKSEAKATGYASTSISSIFTGIFKNAVKLADKLDLVNFGIQKFKESIGTLKDMSTILNDISKASNITQKDLKQLADDSFQIAGKYGKSGTNYLESVREMARSGYGDNSKEMGELSLLAQSAGEMTADLANRYLLATDSAYKYGGQVEKLTAALDGANNVSDKNNISLTEIAEASRISASDASKAGVSIDQLTAAEAAMIAVTKGSGSEIGESFQSVLLHLQKVKGEFNGEIIDDAQIQKVENRCRELGVQLETMSQNGTKLREPMDILKELSEVYRTLPDGSDQKQGLITDLGGKHADSLSALLDNWDLYEKMLTDFSQGGGSALKEAAQEADSWEGRIVSLQNSWDSLVNSLTNQDYVKGGISFLDNAIQGFEKLTETIGAIPVMLTALNTALLAKKPDYGITQIFNPDSGKVDIQGNLMGIDFTAIKNQKKHFKEASDAINKWKEQLDMGKTDIDSFGEAIVENNSHLKAYLSTCSKEMPPSLKGYQSYLKSLGISTDVLKFKTILLTEALSFGIGLGLQALISGITNFIQSQEKMRQATTDAAKSFADTSSSINDYKSKYEALHNELTNASTTEERQREIKSELLSLQQELNEKYGDEYGRLNLVTNAYKDQSLAIKELNKTAAQKFLNENVKGIEDAERKMTEKKPYFLGHDIGTYSESGSQILDIAKKFEKQGIKTDLNEADGSYSIKINADAANANKVINDFMTEVALLEKKFGKDDDFVSSVLETSSTSLNESQNILDDYQEKYNTALMAQIATNDKLSAGYDNAVNAVKEYNEALASGDETKILSARDELKSVKDSIDLSSDSWKRYSSIMTNVFDHADTGIYDFRDALSSNKENLKSLAETFQGMSKEDLLAIDNSKSSEAFDRLNEAGKKYGLTTEQIIDELARLKIIQGEVSSTGKEVFAPLSSEDIIANIDSLSEGLESLDKIRNGIEDKGTPFDYSLLNDKTFKENFGNLGNAYTNFIDKIISSPKDLDSTQSAFNELITAWIDGSGVLNGLTKENENLAISILKSKGVSNAEEIVISNLNAKKIEACLANLNFSDSIEEQISAMRSELEIYGLTETELDNLTTACVNAQNAMTTALSTGVPGRMNILEAELKAIKGVADSYNLINQEIKAPMQNTGDTYAEAQRNFNTNMKLNPGLAEQVQAVLDYGTSLDEVQELINNAKNIKGNVVQKNNLNNNKTTTSSPSAKEAVQSQKDMDLIDQRLQLLEEKRTNLLANASRTYIDYLGITQDEFNRAKELFHSNISPMSSELDELFYLAQKSGMSIGELYTLISEGAPPASKQNYLSQILEVDKQLLEDYQKKVEQYQSDYDKALEKVSPEYRNKIGYEDIPIDTLPVEEAENVQNAINAQSQLEEATKKQSEAQSKYIEDTLAPYEKHFRIHRERQQANRKFQFPA